jgi:O-antigen/teichoic acid export membrane protein
MLTKLAASGWSVLEYGWYPLLLFVATPYLLRTLGAEGFGYWMLLSAIVGFGSILNIGTGAATIKQVSANCANPEKVGVKNIISASMAIALVGGGSLAAIIVLLFWFAGDVLFSKMGDSSLVLLTGIVAALLAWIEQIDNVFASVLKGSERFGRAASIEMVSKTAQVLAAVLAVSVWGGVAMLYSALVLVSVGRLVAKFWFVGRLWDISSLRPSFANAHDVLHFAKWGWLQGMGGLMFGVADRMLVGSILGATSLAHYSIATQLAQQIHALSAAGMSVIFPKVSRKLADDGSFALWRIAKLTIAGNFLVSSILMLGLLIFGRQILTLWLGDAMAAECADVLWYLTIAYWLLAINVAPHFILLGVGRIRFVALSNIAAGVMSLIVMYVLVQLYGLMGVGIARIIYGAIILVNFVSLFEYLRGRSGQNAE